MDILRQESESMQCPLVIFLWSQVLLLTIPSDWGQMWKQTFQSGGYLWLSEDGHPNSQWLYQCFICFCPYEGCFRLIFMMCLIWCCSGTAIIAFQTKAHLYLFNYKRQFCIWWTIFTLWRTELSWNLDFVIFKWSATIFYGVSLFKIKKLYNKSWTKLLETHEL